MKLRHTACVLLAVSSFHATAFAAPPTSAEEDSRASDPESEPREEGSEALNLDYIAPEGPDIEVISVFGRKADLTRITGSAHVVNEEQLERFEYDDIERVLSKVPGVYLRGEDGFGLRPNIGLRGAASDRSSKVTLMEDGVLFGPAPYSAPAAYYFPLTTRMQAVEVYKGPSSIRYGPNTIGGAINLVTAAFPTGWGGMVDVSGGQYRYGKAHGRVGYGGEQFSVLLEGLRLQTTGFKDLDGGGDTGFGKNDTLLKLRYVVDPASSVYQRIDLKLGYADEYSNETYLGLSVEDFRETPNRRYAASQRDRMVWDRTQAQLSYLLEVGGLTLDVTAYRHDFARNWRRVGGFSGNAVTSSFNTVLRDPTFEILRRTLTGELDSLDPSNPATRNLIAQPANDRDFVSQGIEARAEYRFDTGALEHRLQLGARYHYDRIRRRQTEVDFAMTDGVLEPLPGEERIITWNAGRTWAMAAYLADEITLWSDLVLTPGLRVERIRTEFRDRTPEDPSQSNELSELTLVEATSTIAIPGIGLYYALTDQLGVLAGVHRGFSPVAPGPTPDGEVSPEDSVNYELGARFSSRRLNAELIGFFSDYDNLLANCTFSAGCAAEDLDRQINAGSVLVYGLEASLAGDAPLSDSWSFIYDGSLTLTQSEFQSTFESASPQFGEVEAGDFIPYVPRVQGHLGAGVEGETLGFFASATYIGAMLDEAATGSDEDAFRTDDAVIVDVSAAYRPWEGGTLYATVNNALDRAYIASYRPFGARPGRPLMFKIGLRQSF